MFAIYLSRCTVVLTNLILRKMFHIRIVNCRLRITLSSFNFSRSSKHTTCNFRYRHRDQDARLKIKKVYFFWICPDTNAFEWFSDLLQSLEQQVRTEFMLLLLALCLGVQCVYVFTSLCLCLRIYSECSRFSKHWKRRNDVFGHCCCVLIVHLK